MSETLKEKTAKGLFWGGLSSVVQQGIGLLVGIILARLLARTDYGMIGMITIFSLVANNLQSSGFKVGLINMKSPRHEDYNSVFWFNIVASLVIYVVLFFSSPLIASYFNQPALVWLCRYVFLGFVFSGIGLAPSAWLTKNLQFKHLAQCSITAVVVSSVFGVGLACLGLGYWALATQNLTYIAANTLMLWHYSSWRPTLNCNFRPVRQLFPFSVKIMLTAIFTDINNSIINLILGKHYTAQDTGDYFQASQWNSKAYLLIQDMVRRVDQPILVSLHDERQRQLHVLRKMIRFTAFLSFPLLFGLALVSHEFIVLAIGEKWASSASLLPLLCIAGAFTPISMLMADMIMSRGRSDTYMWCTIVLGILQVLLMSLMWPWGIRVMVVAFVSLNIVWVGVWHHFVAKQTGYRFHLFLKDTIPFALAAFGVMAVVHYSTLSITSLWVLLFCRVVLAACLYYLTMRLVRAKILEDCRQFILSRLKKL